MIKRYEFENIELCNAAADLIYDTLRRAGYKQSFENLEGHSHQIYRIFAKDAKSYHPGEELMRFEFNAVVEPPILRVDCGTSRDNIVFYRIVEDAVDDHKGRLVEDKKKRPDLG